MNKDSYNNIDAQFADHFEGKSVSLKNSDDFWSELQTKRGKNSRSKLWFLSLLTLFGLSTAFFLYQMGNKSETIADTIKSINRVPLAQESKASPALSLSNENDFKIEDESRTIKEKNITNDNNDTAKRTENKWIDKVNNSTRSSSLLAAKSTLENENLGEKEVILDNNILDQTLSGLSNNDVLSSEQRINARAVNWTNLQTIANNNYQIADRAYQLKPIANKPDWSKCHIRSRGNWFIDVYGQGVKVLESLDSKNENEPYRRDYENNFSPAYGLMTGAMLGHKFPSGFMISGGLEHQRFQSEYESAIRKVTIVKEWDPMAYFTIDIDGNKVYVGDTVTVTQITERKEIVANNTTQWNIPIHIGIQRKKEAWRYGFDMGAIFNLTKKYEGLHMLETRNITPLDKDNYEEFMTNKTGLSFTAGVHLGRMITQQTEVYINPRFRLNSSNYFNDKELLSLKNNFAGVRIGLRYYIGN